MISDAQHLQKLERVKKVIDTFLSYEDISINQLSEIIHVSSSTIQRDLNDIEYIHDIYEDRAKDILIKSINHKNHCSILR
jgi:predicted DNA-binding transcriptional regulator YafY